MLEQCMDTLDQQNATLTEQAQELALLRSKMRHLEYVMDAFKYSTGRSIHHIQLDVHTCHGQRAVRYFEIGRVGTVASIMDSATVVIHCK
jgi:hypothetical protein